ncbi:hypothetical protein [Kitasatospora sp. GP82]|uniref:hypothetical protein n=1 Tax=Kitasatospora sp. GP82 TaxID=3035089 RepID=UPI002473C550|nr:hypothetical protein [Kitasatospora sp. GP82]MDH6125028.1 hypothetical protein [Kitasatospora sp. GP82]
MVPASGTGELQRRHRAEYTFLRRSLDAYGVDFASRELDPAWKGAARGEVRRQLLGALADGSWRSTPLPTELAARPSLMAPTVSLDERNAELNRQVRAGLLSERAAKRKRQADNRRRRAYEASS